MPLPPRVGHTVQEHDRRRRWVAGFHVMPRDAFTVAGGVDEAVHDGCLAELFAFTVLVRLGFPGVGKLDEHAPDALEQVLFGLPGKFGGDALRWIGVGVGKIHGHVDGSFRVVSDRTLSARAVGSTNAPSPD